MVCVAITRGGLGDVWLFDTRTAAYLHPLVQYGDALLTTASDVVSQYNKLEWQSLRALAGLPLAILPTTPREWQMFAEFQADHILDSLTKRAVRPSSDPQQICDTVSRDRRLGTIMAKKKDTAPADATTTAAASTETKVAGQVRGPKGVPGDAVVQMGTDTAGAKYGPDNNPKKVGSKTHGRFAGYVEGMTVTEALATGLTTADLVYDAAHGFVSFVGGTAIAEATTVEATTEADPAADGEQEQEAA